jgi:hypothetical protein
VGTKNEKTGIGWKERKEGAECARERETIEHMWNESSERKERERKERGEILTEDGDRMDERYIEKERQNGKKGVGDRKKNVIFLEIIFIFR